MSSRPRMEYGLKWNPNPPITVPQLVAYALATGVYTVLAWKDSYWGITGRLYYTLVTIASVAFVWFLNYWNLLGWRY